MSQLPLLRIDNVTKRFGEVLAVDGVSLDVSPGETLAIVGESGSGKSTLANLVLGSESPSAGEIVFDGRRIDARRPRALRRRIALVQQNPYLSLNPRKSVGQSIALPLIVHRIVPHARRRARIAELLRMVGLTPDFADRRPLSLSGGQRQRVAIARALATEPDLLVLDEPTSALDVSVQAHVLRLLKELQAELGLTYVFITHDLGVVRVMASRVAVMYRGRIAETAPVEQLFAAPRHRYTNMLFASIPTTSEEEDALRPDWPWDATMEQLDRDEGCAFAPRCPFRIERCSRERPSLAAIGDGAAHACLAPAAPHASARGPSLKYVTGW